MKKFGKLMAFAALFILFIAFAVGRETGASINADADVLVDYVNETMTVTTTKDTVIYFTDIYYPDITRWEQCEVRDGKAVFDISWVKDQLYKLELFIDWYRRTSKHAPTGLYVFHDDTAIGVDNDPLLCDFSTPPLTSVAPDHILEGQFAAKTIDRMMRQHGAPAATRILNTAKKMEERESAKPISPVTSLITRALAFISANAEKNIKVADVADALGVSRSLLDLRFREFRNETISKAITRTRLESVKRLLSDTGLSIRAISAKCGFANPNHLKNLFRRHFGMSMREWRADAIDSKQQPG